MLKKAMLFCILMSVSPYTFALPFSQCPPVSALKHPVKGQAWVLDPEYVKEGWSVDTRNDQALNDSDAVELTPSPNLRVEVAIISADLAGAEGKEVVGCRYELVPGRWWGFVSVARNQMIDEKSIPQPPFHSPDSPLKAYFCEMPMTSSFTYCAWPIK